MYELIVITRKNKPQNLKLAPQFPKIYMPENAVKVFISYSHKDEALRDSLATHLSNLQWQGIISSWYDRQLVAGMEWDDKIKTELDSADIILLLISPDFIASRYCRDVEIPMALQRHEARQAYVVPVILRPFDWFDAPFAKLQAFPKDAKPVTTWSNQDEAFVSVTQGIRTAAKLMLDYRKQEVEQKQLVRAQYLQKVEEVLSDGVISIVERDTLDELRETLGLTSEEAKEVETHAYEPFSRYEESLNKYKQTLTRLIEKGYYPFSEEIEKDLENRQRDLGLKPEDAIRVSKPILDQAELDHQAKKKGEVSLIKQPAQEWVVTKPDEISTKVEKHPLLNALEQHKEKSKQQVQEAEVHLKMGFNLFMQAKTDEAVIQFQKAIQLNPNDVRAYSLLAPTLQRQGKLDEAIAIYHKAIQLDPNNSEVYAALGTTLQEQGKLDEAITLYQKAIKFAPNAAPFYFVLGLALCSHGKIDAAVMELQKAINLDPQNTTYQEALEITSLDSLENALKSNDWESANKITWVKLHKLFNQHELSDSCLGVMLPEALERVPRDYIKSIDQLWQRYSNNHFGFSIQKNKFLSVNRDANKFAGIVGWKGKAGFFRGLFAWKGIHQLDFSLNAPEGCFPLDLNFFSIEDNVKDEVENELHFELFFNPYWQSLEVLKAEPNEATKVTLFMNVLISRLD